MSRWTHADKPWAACDHCGRVDHMTMHVQTEKVTPTGGIVLAGLTKTFKSPKGPVHAVRGVDITIHRGETVALLGPNGAGKSTTIDMMLGLSAPDRGEVRIFGQTPEAAVDAGIVGAMLQ